MDADGIAAEHGLPLRATNVDGSGECNWWITEVNHRSLNLFYKDSEVSPPTRSPLDASLLVYFKF